MRRVGILGGTFNPPHLGHLIIANEVKHALQLDEVRLMPTAQPPHKEAVDSVLPNDRLKMVQLAVEGTDDLNAFPFEIERGGISYTVDTIAALMKTEPDVQFYFIIGGDMIDQLHTWHRIDELIEMVTFVGINRPDTEGSTRFPIERVTIPDIPISSTFIRERLHRQETVRFLIPKAVEAYIYEEGLYGTDSKRT